LSYLGFQVELDLEIGIAGRRRRSCIFILLELEKHATWPAFPSAMIFPHKLLLFFVVP
jgi:hypothetical protein